mmetsp:Transcript_3129/g.6149  ORF Transcript_3129/g.6149 Transcript_3129/m.6149 type:complete len:523 (-) Transcript_3129:241-1809(-)|eukprot:CAMPEP_0114252868 /NCGR_PEP_ID=MMETSP0058-20121206/16078_1 /TAXON_ID=36894 /ORGANISM="Pyramimonas parkeae, CCMP726" /LENGTH=522 /DNA_ID=CAMNT_0001366855 /DNA_START=150 /DNA_END=1718 /DNA_ORIENTATION=+
MAQYSGYSSGPAPYGYQPSAPNYSQPPQFEAPPPYSNDAYAQHAPPPQAVSYTHGYDVYQGTAPAYPQDAGYSQSGYASTQAGPVHGGYDPAHPQGGHAISTPLVAYENTGSYDYTSSYSTGNATQYPDYAGYGQNQQGYDTAYGSVPAYDQAGYVAPAYGYGEGDYYGSAGFRGVDPYVDQRYPGAESNYSGSHYSESYASGNGYGDGAGDIYADQQYTPKQTPASMASTGSRSRESTRNEERLVNGPKGEERFRVTLVPGDNAEPESAVVQIGLDGVQVLNESGTRTKNVYALDCIARWSMPDATVLTFWYKPDNTTDQTIRIMATENTNRALLDTLTCSCLQLCEMRGVPFDGSSGANGEQSNALAAAAAEDREAAAVDDSDKDIEFWVEPEREGWLQSQGEVIKTWRRRWFVLKQNRLFRFKEHRLTSKSVIRGLVKLSDVEQVRAVDDPKFQKNAFELVMKSGPSQYFVADTGAEQAIWINEIKRKLSGGADNERRTENLVDQLQRDMQQMAMRRGK